MHVYIAYVILIHSDYSQPANAQARDMSWGCVYQQKGTSESLK